MYEDDVKALDEWFANHTSNDTYHRTREKDGEDMYVVGAADVESFCNYIEENIPDLIVRTCRVDGNDICFSSIDLDKRYKEYLTGVTADILPQTGIAISTTAIPSQQEPSEDTISRQAVHRQINKWVASGDSGKNLLSLHKRVDTLPPVTPQQKIGKWINADGDTATCSCCNRINFLYGIYCKHCGAKMDEEDGLKLETEE